VKWKLEIRNEVIGKNGIRIEIEFFSEWK